MSTKVLRVDRASYGVIQAYREELQRRRRRRVTLGEAARELLVATAKRIMAEDHHADRRL